MKKVVAIGGGTGLSYLVKGLRDFPIELSAVVAVSDNGRSTGRLREEFTIPAVGDIRKVISNLSTLPQDLADLFEYRFSTYSALDDHSLGNLLLASLVDKTESLSKGVLLMNQLLDVKSNIYPISDDYLTLMAKYKDGAIVEGEEEIGEYGGEVETIYYKEKAKPHPDAILAIEKADLIILSMGSLYTSVIPNLLFSEVVEAIDKSKGKILYVCNVMTENGETKKMTASDHVKVLDSFLNKRKIDAVLVNKSHIPSDFIKKYYDEENKEKVRVDKENLKKLNKEVICENVVSLADGTIKHNSDKLAAYIFAYLIK